MGAIYVTLRFCHHIPVLRDTLEIEKCSFDAVSAHFVLNFCLSLVYKKMFLIFNYFFGMHAFFALF